MPNPYTGNDNDPFSQAQHLYAGKDWERFFQSLQGKRVSMGGFGRAGGQSLAEMGRPGDEDTVRTVSTNLALGNLLDARGPRDQSLRAMTAHNDANDRAMRDQQEIDRAMAIANTPGVSQYGRIVQDESLTGSGKYRDAPLTGQEPPVNRQAVAAQMAPGLIAPPPTAPPVTYGKPEPAMVDGKRMFVRAGSDGQMYDTARRPIDPAALAPDETPASSVSPEGVELAARNYLTTGVMPPLGMGDKGTRQAILNKAAEIGGTGANIAANKADYKADAGSLATLQRQRDTIGAFEETAGKNIDIFLNAAGKIVDTGSPMANMLVRNVSGKVLGSPDQAAFDAARQVAVNEIAKITSNPNLTGQLSDSARHEVEAFNPREATLAQSVAVMRLLKQDMTNRITSLDDAVKNVKGRIRPDEPPAPGGTVELIAPDGGVLDVPAGEVAALMKAHPTLKRKGGG